MLFRSAFKGRGFQMTAAARPSPMPAGDARLRFQTRGKKQ